MLRFGVSFLPDASPATMPADEYFRAALEVCDLADRTGYEYAKMTEHYLHPYGGYCPSPLMFLSAVAARTRTIRLMTGGIMASFHHPVQIATHAAMLDALSGGRADIGFARAWLPHEFDLFEISMDESRARFVDTVEAVLRIWTEAGASADSQFFHYSGVDLLPECVQRPHPPVWAAAVQSPESFEWIARKGFGLLITPGLRGYASVAELVARYRRTFIEEHAGTGAAPQVALSLPLVIADSDQEAVEASDLYLGRYLDAWRGAAAGWGARQSADYPTYSGLTWALAGESAKTVRDRVSAVVGSPDRAAEQVAYIREQLDPDVILWQVDTGSQPLDQALRTVRLFAEQVRPKL